VQRGERRGGDLAVFLDGETFDPRTRRTQNAPLWIRRHGPDVLVVLLADVGQPLDRDAVLSEESATRQAAIIAILPVTGLDDLTTLHEYVYRFPDDETEVLTQVRARAEQLEMLWEKRQDLESTDPTPDD